VDKNTTVVIVGASLAGAHAAASLRDEGFEGRVVLLGEEPHRPYERPPLSKDYLQGASDGEKVFVHSDAFYPEHEIELRTGIRAVAVDTESRTVTLADGGSLSYDRLLLATGSQARALDVPGADLDGVFTLRTLDDSDRLRRALSQAGSVVVVGSGWIGSEVAASARSLGREVTLVARDQVPLERVLGPEVGEIYRQLHADHGVRLLMGTKVEAIRGSDTVQEVHTSDGQTIASDLVVVGVGAAPRLELARDAGLVLNDGIATNDHLHTSANWVYAAGDVAAAWHPRYRRRLRVEHWANARNHGRVAARNMLGADETYDRVPYFYSDQFDLGMEYSGHAPGWDQVVFRGQPDQREFIAFWLRDHRVVAAMNANVWDVVEALQAVIASERIVDPARLTDPDTPLDTDALAL
jgi:3-phenylpropionate/trans-cinnamate dioxygenase ferredoxin reductase component